jgi:hypothetical protein
MKESRNKVPLTKTVKTAISIDVATSAEEDDDVREFRQLAACQVFQTLAAEENEPW